MFEIFSSRSSFFHWQESSIAKNYSTQTTYLLRRSRDLGLYMALITLFFSYSALAQPGGVPVKIASVQELMMAPVRKVPAIVEAKFVATIKTESKGIIREIAEVGTALNKGDIIAQLVDTQVRHRKDELNGAIRSSQAKLTFLKSENARLNGLVEKNLISNSELEQNKSDFISARHDLVQAKSRLKQYLDQVTKLQVEAPYDGVILQQLSQPGQLLNAGDDIIEFMQANNLEVIVNVPFKYKSQIRVNAVWQIETSGDMGNTQLIDAKIERFIPAARGQSHTIEVYLTVNSNASGDDLWSGEAVNVLVPTQTKKKVIAVPRDALVIRKSGSFVYTIIEGKSHKVDVITGMAEGDLIEVKGLLSSDDSVIIRGNERLTNEQSVKVIE